MSTAQLSKTVKDVQTLLKRSEVQEAFKFIESHLKKITDEQIRICQIAAPPFAEQKRAAYFQGRFSDLGLRDVHIDQEGNCVGLRQGERESPLLVISAHLDTVFREGTDVTVSRSGQKLLAPGISDDCCGLVALVAIGDALQAADIQTEGSVLFVATVGEEGEGNLRGVRHLMTTSSWANRIEAFISFDGAEIDRITNQALGSRRYRVGFRGEGGHSWGDFGVANPVHAAGRAITKLASYPLPLEPRTTFNVGRVEGGSSVNSIPQDASMEVDLRSESAEELLKLDAFFRRAVREATEDENAARRAGERPLQLTVQLIGERPSGQTSADSTLVQLAIEATEAVGTQARLNQASTDSNLPISLGIPAITIGAGGTSGNSHTLDEWYDPRGREFGLKRGLLLALSIVGVVEN
ncbi:MAG TPA: M20/M25/M40 family metallo-hydrolase [Pyrinomonadaceae bacterium]|nr:M20/M25/M40 family metallo-hydrolase [Pyrinomonadaceae bacterium]